MATVRVLATKVGSDRVPVPRLVYRAQIVDEIDREQLIWTCDHEHSNPIDAQSCGLQQLHVQPAETAEP